KGPDFWRAFRRRRGSVIGDEPGNTREDPDPSEEALSQGEGGAGIPLLPALRQDLPQRHPGTRLRAGPDQRGCAGGGRGELRGDRGGRTGGRGRPPGTPTTRDRVVQAAGKLVLEPIFEADLDPAAYGYRPGRGGTDAIKAVHALLCRVFHGGADPHRSRVL